MAAHRLPNPLQQARRILLKQSPFLAPLIFRLYPDPVPDLDKPFAVTSDFRLAYNPAHPTCKDDSQRNLRNLYALLRVQAIALLQRHGERLASRIARTSDTNESRDYANASMKAACAASYTVASHGVELEDESILEQFGVPSPRDAGYSIYDYYPKEDTVITVYDRIMRSYRNHRLGNQALSRLTGAFQPGSKLMATKTGQRHTQAPPPGTAQAPGEASRGGFSRTRAYYSSMYPPKSVRERQPGTRVFNPDAAPKVSPPSSMTGIPTQKEGTQRKRSRLTRAMDNTAITATAHRVTQEIADRRSSGCGLGDTLAALEYWAITELSSKMPPEALMRRFIYRNLEWELSGEDSRFDGRNPRQAFMRRVSGLDLMVATDWGPVADINVLLDVSGSMDETQIKDAASMIVTVVRRFGVTTPVSLYLGTTTVRSHAIVRPSQIAEAMAVCTGGGTDLGYCMQMIAKNTRSRISSLIVITDGITPWPARPFKFPVLIALTTRETRGYRTPDWATVIHL